MNARRMTSDRPDPLVACLGHCHRCGMLSVASLLLDEKVAGWRLVWRAFFVFLVPLIAAAAGAYVAGGSAVSQLVGAVAGFAAGLAIAVTMTRLFKIQ